MGAGVTFSIASVALLLMLQRRAAAHKVNRSVTLICTTSVIPSHPSLDRILAVLNSYISHEPLLANVRKIIVCDCPKVIPSEKVEKFKQGRVHAETASNYELYLDRLQKEIDNKSELGLIQAELLILENRHGFALALKRAIDCCDTKYVIVVQHDRNLRRPFGVQRLLRELEISSDINYIGLQTKATSNYEEKARHRYMVDLKPLVKYRQGYKLVPLIFWFDSTHFCRTEFYRSSVLQPLETHRGVWRWNIGDFVEDKYGQLMSKKIRALGLEAHAEFGAYLFDDEDYSQGMVGHISGRKRSPLENYNL